MSVGGLGFVLLLQGVDTQSKTGLSDGNYDQGHAGFGALRMAVDLERNAPIMTDRLWRIELHGVSSVPRQATET